MALGIGPGAEVITPTYSFFATAGCISRLGAVPVFVDIDPLTFNIDVAGVERALTPRTRAIVPVHLFGLAADMDPLLALAGRAGVPIIEDAAQAIGARYRGRELGGLGAVGCYSFFPSKNLGGFGDAGMVTTNDARLAREIRLLRNHGMDPKYFHTRIGGNFRIDAMQAAVLRVKAPRLQAWSNQRRRNADRYRELATAFGVSGHVELPVEPAGCTHIYNQFVIRATKRDDLRRHLTSHGIGTEIYYPVPFHRQDCFSKVPSAANLFPVADRAAATSVALPIYSELTEHSAASRHAHDRGLLRPVPMKRLVLVVGAGGQLGETMVDQLSVRHVVVPVTRHELDVTDARAVMAFAGELCPDVIVNCSAYTNVDGAESDPVAALAVNAMAVRALARAATHLDAALVHYSTDFVFDGKTDRPYAEEDPPNPRGTYAMSKLLGEWFAAETPRHYVLRVESLFGGERARSSIDRILDNLRAGYSCARVRRSFGVTQLRGRCRRGHACVARTRRSGGSVPLCQQRLDQLGRTVA